MHTTVDAVETAVYLDGHVIVTMGAGVEIRFPIAGNPRLSKGTLQQLNRIEISPYGLHWPDLDEDLSFSGLLAGDYGQHCRIPPETWPKTAHSPPGHGRRNTKTPSKHE